MKGTASVVAETQGEDVDEEVNWYDGLDARFIGDGTEMSEQAVIDAEGADGG